MGRKTFSIWASSIEKIIGRGMTEVEEEKSRLFWAMNYTPERVAKMIAAGTF